MCVWLSGCWAGLQLAVVCLFLSLPTVDLPWRWSQLPINLSQLVRNTTPPHKISERRGGGLKGYKKCPPFGKRVRGAKAPKVQKSPLFGAKRQNKFFGAFGAAKENLGGFYFRFSCGFKRKVFLGRLLSALIRLPDYSLPQWTWLG